MQFALGQLFGNRGDAQPALDHYHQAYEINRVIGAERSIADNLAQAETYHRRALELGRQSGFREGQAYYLSNLAVVLREQKRFADALQFHNEAMALPDELGEIEARWRTRVGRAETQRRLGQFDAAQRDWGDAIELLEQMRGGLSLEAQQMSFIGEDKMSMYEKFILFLWCDAKNARRAFEYAERAKARVMVEQLAATTIPASPEVPIALFARERALLYEARGLGTSARLGPERIERQRAVNNLLQAFWKEIELHAPEYIGLRFARPLSFTRLHGVIQEPIAIA